MRPARSVAVAFAFAALGCVAACGEASDADASSSDDPIALGPQREAPLEEPCQWFSDAEATAAMEQAGIRIGGTDVRTVTNSGGDSDVLADCWYLPAETKAGRLVVTLVSSAEAATNWRQSMDGLAAEGGHAVTEHGQLQSLTRVADAPTLQLEAPPGESPSCDVHALLGDKAVVGVELAGDGVSDRDALCSEAKVVLATVVDRLPAA